ncbi:hypothetical protein BaRGS_00027252 [Batillaria attramentaria]|uniref:Uncharacterized protein n=1 Tax=Batillaria attramentaria TaxID=370345 RepID=A0ABD0K269_9CAEN
MTDWAHHGEYEVSQLERRSRLDLTWLINQQYTTAHAAASSVGNSQLSEAYREGKRERENRFPPSSADLLSTKTRSRPFPRLQVGVCVDAVIGHTPLTILLGPLGR